MLYGKVNDIVYLFTIPSCSAPATRNLRGSDQLSEALVPCHTRDHAMLAQLNWQGYAQSPPQQTPHTTALALLILLKHKGWVHILYGPTSTLHRSTQLAYSNLSRACKQACQWVSLTGIGELRQLTSRPGAPQWKQST